MAGALSDLDGLDVEALKTMVIELRSDRDAKAQFIEHQRLMLDKLRKMLFGKKSEKLRVEIEQLELQLEDAEAEQAAEEQIKPRSTPSARSTGLPASHCQNTWNARALSTSHRATVVHSVVDRCDTSAKMLPKCSSTSLRTSR